jgi:phenylacetate-coenzyme A ligase PaaK-like adenylate-forming protein
VLEKEDELAHGIDLKESSIRITFHPGEPEALIPAIREKIMESWGAKPFDYPGMAAVRNYGIHCVALHTSIHVNAAEFILELIDLLI